MFEKRLVAGWGDMDFNSHMRNTAFLDKSADVRMMFFAENGFSMDEFIRRKIGMEMAEAILTSASRCLRLPMAALCLPNRVASLGEMSLSSNTSFMKTIGGGGFDLCMRTCKRFRSNAAKP